VPAKGTGPLGGGYLRVNRWGCDSARFTPLLGAAGIAHGRRSRADIQVTHRITEAGRLLGITVHDHVIVGKEGQVSLRAKGLI